MRNWRRAYWASSANTGADTAEAKVLAVGSSITTMIDSCGSWAGTKPAKVVT